MDTYRIVRDPIPGVAIKNRVVEGAVIYRNPAAAGVEGPKLETGIASRSPYRLYLGGEHHTLSHIQRDGGTGRREVGDKTPVASSYIGGQQLEAGGGCIARETSGIPGGRIREGLIGAVAIGKRI